MRKLFSFYLYAIILGIILLLLPISLHNINDYVKYVSNTETKPYTFFDAFFTAVSAFSDTGLSTLIIGKTYNVFGQIVILFLIQVGGLGLFTIYWMLWNLFFNNILYKKIKKLPLYEANKMNFTNSLIISSERGNSKLGLTSQTIKTALIFIFVIEIIFAIIYAIFFATSKAYDQIPLIDYSQMTNAEINKLPVMLQPGGYYSDLTISGTEPIKQYHSWYALWAGIFQSVSAINNAGFDIIGGWSLAPYRNGAGTILQLITILEIVVGGIGYPVIYDLLRATQNRVKGLPYKFTLFTKISLISYFSVSLIGLIFMFGFGFGMKTSLFNRIDYLLADPNVPIAIKDNAKLYFGTGSIKVWNQINAIFFMTANARSAGFSTFDSSKLSDSNKWIMIMLMFIGSAPSSTGGGIRTTTLAIMIWTVISKIKNYKGTVIFNRRMPSNTVIHSFLISLFGIGLVVVPSLIIYPLDDLINPGVTITDTLFEVASAFGTVGLSAGISGTITNYDATSIINCILLCVVMIIGQLGVPTAIFTFKKKFSKNVSVSFPIEDVKIS